MEIRKPSFNYNLNKNFWADNSILSSLIVSLSVVFPEGERFFIRSVKAFADQADDKLKQDIKLFIAQETIHGNIHEQLNKYLELLGYRTADFKVSYEKFCYGFLEKEITSRFGHKIALAATAGVEHYTATLAKIFYENPELFDKLDGEVKRLLAYHAIEEIEHKAVTFNLMQIVDDSYFYRVAGMSVATFVLFSMVFYGTLMMLIGHKDFKLGKIDFFKSIQLISKLGIETSKYFLPGFRPDADWKDLETAKKEYNRLVA